MTAIAGDKAVVTVVVLVEPAVAFAAFTEEIDLWWRRGPAYRIAGKRPGVLTFESGAGGRLFESYETAAGLRSHVVGTVLVWEPPHRLVFEWRNVNFAPHERTEVEVCFEPARRGTRVTLEHRGWSAIRADHPARHELDVPAFIGMIGSWWADLLTSLRNHTRPEEPG